jgi:hypothetical protein
VSVGHQKAGPSPWLRQIGCGRAVLVYRDLPPAIVRAPGWFEDARFATRGSWRRAGWAHRRRGEPTGSCCRSAVTPHRTARLPLHLTHRPLGGKPGLVVS